MSTRLSEMNLPRFPRLKDEETAELLERAQQGDLEARERLIKCNLRLVFNLVQRFTHRGYEEEDLFQIGTIGLIKAIDKFDTSHQVKFSTYAVPMIIGEIRRFLRDDHPVKVSRSIKEVAFRVPRVKEELTKQQGREPTIGEIAEAMGMPREDVVGALEAIQHPTSIHETLYQDDGDPIFVLDQLTSDQALEHHWIDNLALKEVLERITEREKRVLFMRFFEDRTQSDVAKLLGLSQVQISRIERQALTKIKEFLSPAENK
ncbi:MAG: RNA polymerase sporulation sigma factor SigF [Firmicutes bacterium]|nr:RNA polymerase sporulation sigma factor SigF [Bacillota bacterium]